MTRAKKKKVRNGNVVRGVSKANLDTSAPTRSVRIPTVMWNAWAAAAAVAGLSRAKFIMCTVNHAANAILEMDLKEPDEGGNNEGDQTDVEMERGEERLGRNAVCSHETEIPSEGGWELGPEYRAPAWTEDEETEPGDQPAGAADCPTEYVPAGNVPFESDADFDPDNPF